MSWLFFGAQHSPMPHFQANNNSTTFTLCTSYIKSKTNLLHETVQ